MSHDQYIFTGFFPAMNYQLTRAATLGALLLLVTACLKSEDATPIVDINDNMALGNPSGATASITSPTNYLLTR